MTREDNETAISNAERATMANDAGADIAIRFMRMEVKIVRQMEHWF